MLATTPPVVSVPDAILAHFLAADPANADRIYRAAELVSHVERSRGTLNLWLVFSASEPNRAYQVDATSCSCQDFQKRGGQCKHRIALAFFQQIERAEVDAEQAARPRCPVCGRPADRGCIDQDGNRLCTCDDHGDWEVPAIRVDPEDSILDLWTGEVPDLAPQCWRCQREPAIAPDGSGARCLSAELFGEEV